MKIEPQTDFWTTRDGTHVRICEMDDNHLMNTIRMLERKSEMIRTKYLISHFGIFTFLDMSKNICHFFFTFFPHNSVI